MTMMHAGSSPFLVDPIGLKGLCKASFSKSRNGGEVFDNQVHRDNQPKRWVDRGLRLCPLLEITYTNVNNKPHLSLDEERTCVILS
jgi:hypothetical protein